MVERLTEATVIDYEKIREVSESTRLELAGFQNQEEDEIAAPRDLFICLPGRTMRVATTIDNGCRGSWTEHHDLQLGDEPHKVILIERSMYKKDLIFTLESAGSHLRPTRLSDEDMLSARFFEYHDGDEDLNDFDKTVKQSLEVPSFKRTKIDQLASSWRYGVSVRARSPLKQPVSVKHPNDFSKIYPLDCAFEYIDSYFDSQLGKTMVRVVVGNLGGDRDESTNWVELDWLEFRTVELEQKQALAAELFRVAEQLIASPNSTEAINALLSSAEAQVMYPLAYNRQYDRREHPAKSEFLLGQVAVDNTIRGLFAPELKTQSGYKKPHLRADRVLISESQPWLVDDTSSLATPLASPVFITRDTTSFSPIEEWVDATVAEKRQED